MKLAIIFLAIFVAVSHQQYYQYRLPEFPWIPNPYSRKFIPAHVHYFNDYLPNNHQITEYDYLPPMNTPFSYKAELNPAIQDLDNPDKIEEFADLGKINTRTEGLGSLYDNQMQQPRFFFLFNNGAANGFNNPFIRTTTYTSTSIVSVANVQNCIPLAQFAAGKEQVRCPPRKRQDLDDSTDQFFIEPSQTLPVTATAAISSNAETGRKIYDQDDNQLATSGISSSKEEPLESYSPDMREKRFFFNRNYYAVSTTVTSYLFVPTAVKNTVNLGGPGTLQCLLTGFIVC